MAKLRFHWDFFGPDAEATARHFLEHVDEFCGMEGIEDHENGVSVQAMRAVATLECDERYLVLVRDRLRPKRAERVG